MSRTDHLAPGRALLAAVTLLTAVSASQALIIQHRPSDRVPPVVVSPAFGPLAVGGVVGANYIGYGVDYSWATVEGIFQDPPLAFGGVNGAGRIDLLSPVDGRIVLPSTLTQGVTNYVWLEAGFADDGSLKLEVFDCGLNLLGTAFNGPPLGPNNRTTVSILRPAADIAYFRISGGDSYGVNTVRIEDPVACGVGPAIPEPGTLALLGFGALTVVRRRKRA